MRAPILRLRGGGEGGDGLSRKLSSNPRRTWEIQESFKSSNRLSIGLPNRQQLNPWPGQHLSRTEWTEIREIGISGTSSPVGAFLGISHVQAGHVFGFSGTNPPPELSAKPCVQTYQRGHQARKR